MERNVVPHAEAPSALRLNARERQALDTTEQHEFVRLIQPDSEEAQRFLRVHGLADPDSYRKRWITHRARKTELGYQRVLQCRIGADLRSRLGVVDQEIGCLAYVVIDYLLDRRTPVSIQGVLRHSDQCQEAWTARVASVDEEDLQLVPKKLAMCDTQRRQLTDERRNFTSVPDPSLDFLQRHGLTVTARNPIWNVRNTKNFHGKAVPRSRLLQCKTGSYFAEREAGYRTAKRGYLFTGCLAFARLRVDRAGMVSKVTGYLKHAPECPFSSEEARLSTINSVTVSGVTVTGVAAPTPPSVSPVGAAVQPAENFALPASPPALSADPGHSTAALERAGVLKGRDDGLPAGRDDGQQAGRPLDPEKQGDAYPAPAETRAMTRSLAAATATTAAPTATTATTTAKEAPEGLTSAEAAPAALTSEGQALATSLVNLCRRARDASGDLAYYSRSIVNAMQRLAQQDPRFAPHMVSLKRARNAYPPEVLRDMYSVLYERVDSLHADITASLSAAPAWTSPPSRSAAAAAASFPTATAADVSSTPASAPMRYSAPPPINPLHSMLSGGMVVPSYPPPHPVSSAAAAAAYAQLVPPPGSSAADHEYFQNLAHAVMLQGKAMFPHHPPGSSATTAPPPYQPHSAAAAAAAATAAYYSHHQRHHHGMMQGTQHPAGMPLYPPDPSLSLSGGTEMPPLHEHASPSGLHASEHDSAAVHSVGGARLPLQHGSNVAADLQLTSPPAKQSAVPSVTTDSPPSKRARST